MWGPWLAAMARQHNDIRYDQRGCGLSDRDPAGLSLDA
jgi:pimeloyl-ACP methyl ester carboxylesterase